MRRSRGAVLVAVLASSAILLGPGPGGATGALDPLEVAAALDAGGIPITFEAIKTSPATAEAATDAADLSITVHKSPAQRSKAQARAVRRLNRAIDEPTALPFLAYANCGAIEVEVADGTRLIDPGPAARQIDGILEAAFGPCTQARGEAPRQAKIARKLCDDLLAAGINETVPTLIAGSIRALDASKSVGDPWRATVVADELGGDVVGPFQAVSAACRDALDE